MTVQDAVQGSNRTTLFTNRSLSYKNTFCFPQTIVKFLISLIQPVSSLLESPGQLWQWIRAIRLESYETGEEA